MPHRLCVGRLRSIICGPQDLLGSAQLWWAPGYRWSWGCVACCPWYAGLCRSAFWRVGWEQHLGTKRHCGSARRLGSRTRQ